MFFGIVFQNNHAHIRIVYLERNEKISNIKKR